MLTVEYLLKCLKITLDCPYPLQKLNPFYPDHLSACPVASLAHAHFFHHSCRIFLYLQLAGDEPHVHHGNYGSYYDGICVICNEPDLRINFLPAAATNEIIIRQKVLEMMSSVCPPYCFIFLRLCSFYTLFMGRQNTIAEEPKHKSLGR